MLQLQIKLMIEYYFQGQEIKKYKKVQNNNSSNNNITNSTNDNNNDNNSESNSNSKSIADNKISDSPLSPNSKKILFIVGDSIVKILNGVFY